MALSNYLINNYRVFYFAERQSKLQIENRNTMEAIRNKVKNAEKIKLFNSLDAVGGMGNNSEENYIYLKEQNIYFMNSQGNEVNLTKNITVDTFNIKLDKFNNKQNYLQITLESNLQERTFKLNSDILLNNIHDKNSDTVNSVIAFSKPD